MNNTIALIILALATVVSSVLNMIDIHREQKKWKEQEKEFWSRHINFGR